LSGCERDHIKVSFFVDLGQDRPETPWSVGCSRGSISDECILPVCFRKGHDRFRCKLFLKSVESLERFFCQWSKFVARILPCQLEQGSGDQRKILPCQLEQGSSDQRKILDVGPEEIAETHKRSDRLDICGWFRIFDGFELILAWFDSFRRESKSQVGDLLVSKYTFFQVYFQMI